MTIRRRFALLCLAVGPLTLPTLGVAEPFTATEMMKLKRLGSPRVSPDGRQIVFVLTEVDLDADSKRSDLWLAARDGVGPDAPFAGREDRGDA